MTDFKRARSNEQREQRRQDILNAAKALFQEAEFKDIKIADVAHQAGVSKGSVFVYFGSKEELFINLTIQEFGAWSDTFTALLPVEPMDTEALLTLLEKSFLANSTLIRLLAISNTILEQNISFEQAVSYKAYFHERLLLMGAVLERSAAGLPRSGGAKFLIYCFALISGLYRMANPPVVIRQVLNGHTYPLFEIDFNTYFLEMLRLILKGMGV